MEESIKSKNSQKNYIFTFRAVRIITKIGYLITQNKNLRVFMFLQKVLSAVNRGLKLYLL